MKAPSDYLPHISRLFPEWLRLQARGYVLIPLSLMIAAGVLVPLYGAGLTKDAAGQADTTGTAPPSVLGTGTAQEVPGQDTQAAELSGQLSYWKTVIGSYPMYRDAYAKAAELAIRLGLYQEAADLVAQGLLLDPNDAALLALKQAASLR